MPITLTSCPGDFGQLTAAKKRGKITIPELSDALQKIGMADSHVAVIFHVPDGVVGLDDGTDAAGDVLDVFVVESAMRCPICGGKL